MSAPKSGISDRHWDASVPSKSQDISKEALGAYKTAKLYVRLHHICSRHMWPLCWKFSVQNLYPFVCMQSCYVKALDGTKLAIDVLLPRSNPGNAPLPCVFFQARYESALISQPTNVSLLTPLLSASIMFSRPAPDLGNFHAVDAIVVHRYTRGLYLRFPFRLMTDGRPYDFINMAFKAELLLAGYAVISMDFRGTGMSLSFALKASDYDLTTAMLLQL